MSHLSPNFCLFQFKKQSEQLVKDKNQLEKERQEREVAMRAMQKELETETGDRTVLEAKLKDLEKTQAEAKEQILTLDQQNQDLNTQVTTSN